MPRALGNVTAVLLAGGLGTRLRTVVADRPKVLAPIRDRPFVYYLLDQLVAAGIRRAVVCTGYLGEQVEAEVGHVYRTLQLVYSAEPSPLGTAGCLRRALPLLESTSVLVLNGDSYCEAPLAAFWDAHLRWDGAATLLLAKVANTARFGRVTVDASGRILEFREKGAAGEGWINAGIYALHTRVFDSLPVDQTTSLEREVFPHWIGRGLHGYAGGTRFIDIGTPESFERAAAFFASP